MTERERIIEEIEIRNEIMFRKAKNELTHFLPYINPNYQLEWFHRLIATKCQELLEGKIKNLMIFVQPQHGKSEII